MYRDIKLPGYIALISVANVKYFCSPPKKVITPGAVQTQKLILGEIKLQFKLLLIFSRYLHHALPYIDRYYPGNNRYFVDFFPEDAAKNK